MKLEIPNFGYTAGGWRVERHPRFLADLTGDGRADIVGFGEAGMYVALNNGDGTFQPLQLAITNFGATAGGWRVERHPRVLADLTGDGRADVIGFGNAGVYVALNNGDGTFQPLQLVIPNFGYTAGGWRVERHPRFLADLTGDGRADIVGFGEAGMYVALNNGDGTFQPLQLAITNFGATAGGWRVERHPRVLADLTGDGRADVIGFGNAGVYVALNNGDGTFQPLQLVIPNFGYTAGGWRVERHPRFLADLTGDGRADIVGFGEAGAYVALNNGDGTFQPLQLAITNFGATAGGWRVERHPRVLADLTGDGRADVIGFGNAGVYVALNNGDGTFQPLQLVIPNFGYTAGGWRVERHPRFLADLTGDGRADIVGFGDAGAYVALNNGDGTFQKTYTRRNIWKLEANSPWDPITLAYAKAIQAMQQRALTDPTSWEYQAAVHGRNGVEPPGVNWNECQHGTWYFLPWHRMYLYEFERIVRAEVEAQGGPSDWALPYWDYSNAGENALPPAFRIAVLPDGSPNPLFVTQRNAGINTGAQLPGSATSSSAAMAQTQFSPAVGNGFGGGKSSPQHFFNRAGELESTPHGDVHVLVGGLMSSFELAGLDPIFWLHHCNIDRLWEVWLALGGGRANPSDAQWQTTPDFPFHNEAGTPVSLNGDAVNATHKLGYEYEDISAETLDFVSDDAEVESMDDAAAPEPNVEMVGASEQPVVLAGGPASVAIAVDTRTIESRRADSAAPQVVLLNLEDIEGEAAPAISYEVYVTAESDPEARVPHYVGNVSFFGIEHASSASGPEIDGPHGMRRTFDISRLVNELTAKGQWADDAVTVSFRPLELIQPAEDTDEADSPEAQRAREIPVRIGRVSLFWA